jgi:hypothetical protein
VGIVLIGLTIFLVILAVATPVISWLFDVKPSLAFAFTPMIYISWNVLVHNSLLMFSREITFAETMNISLFAWLSVSLVSTIYLKTRKRVTLELGIHGFVPAALCVLTSLVAWLIGIGTRFLSPADNDSLSNAFISTRMLSQSNELLCVISNDPTRNINLRFESCGAFVLTHSSNFLHLIPNDRVISVAFLLVAIFLPLGAMTAFPYFGGQSNRKWIAGMTSICFLLFPYGLNGLLRLSVSLALLLPVLALMTDVQGLSHKRLVLLAISLVGIGYVHLLALAVALIYYFATLTISFLKVSLETRNWVSIGANLKKTVFQCLVVVPSYVVFFRSAIVLSSSKSILTAVQVSGTTPNEGALVPVLQSSENSSSFVPGFIDSLWRSLAFETEWTRPQPILALSTYFGLAFFFRQRLKGGAVFLVLVSSLLALFYGVEYLDLHPWIYQNLFLNDWYRLAAILQLLCIIPAAIGIQNGIALVRTSTLPRVSLFVFAVIPFVSIGTGASIVRTAWNNDRTITAYSLNELHLIQPWANLRTLNDPSDGSAWAYSRIGLNLAFPNDRGEFMTQGAVVMDVHTKEDIAAFQTMMENEDALAVLGLGTNVANIQRLDKLGLISKYLINEPGLVFALLKR